MSDFDSWKALSGFPDDAEGLFHSVFEWIPPKEPPKNMTKEYFEELLKTDEGRKRLEHTHTSKGFTIGNYKQLVKEPFKEWKESEERKYVKYVEDCITGNNQS